MPTVSHDQGDHRRCREHAGVGQWLLDMPDTADEPLTTIIQTSATSSR